MADQFSKCPTNIILGQPFVLAKVKCYFYHCVCTRMYSYAHTHTHIMHVHNTYKSLLYSESVSIMYFSIVLNVLPRCSTHIIHVLNNNNYNYDYIWNAKCVRSICMY